MSVVGSHVTYKLPTASSLVLNSSHIITLYHGSFEVTSNAAVRQTVYNFQVIGAQVCAYLTSEQEMEQSGDPRPM